MAKKIRAHVFVSGMVQGVFYRAYAAEMAKKLNIKGWIRNLRDGRVEAVFEGEEENVKKMVKWCHKGSPAARVKKVEVKWEEYKKEFKDFKIKYF